MKHIDIYSKGDVVRYLQELQKEGQIKDCIHIKVNQGYLDAFYPECEEDLASRVSATNVALDITGYGRPSSYHWPKCPEDCPRYKKADDFFGSIITINNSKGTFLMDNNYFKTVCLEKEQKELLCIIVEAARNVPSENRQEFSIVRSSRGQYLQHPGLPDGERKFFFPDLQTLMNKGLIQMTGANLDGVARISVPPEGFRFYRYLKKQSGEPVEHIEKEVHGYIDSHEFQKEYPKAYENWSEAEGLIWENETSKQLTKIGHLCRQAIQEFIDTLYTQVNPPGEFIPKDKTKNRLGKIIAVKSKELGETERKFLKGLHKYLDVTNDLIQKQVHGAQKEKLQLVWKDGRRVVFQTMMFMYEVSQSLKLQSYERQ